MNLAAPTPLKYLILFVFCFLLSVLLNGILLKFSRNLGKRNVVESIVRWASEQKPSFGGISFYIVFLISYSIYTIFFSKGESGINIQNLGILMACGIAFLMGLSDDAYNTKPLLKLSVQLISGLILVSTGTYITLFDIEILNYLITIIWVVALMNSINMLDNMDAITTTVSAFISLTMLTIGFYNGFNSSEPFLITSLLSVFAALCGFLIYNWNPSKMFMGDTGSQFLGIFLSAFAIIYLWNYKQPSGLEYPTKQIVFVALAFIVPAIDTATVIINRLKKGQSPFVGGKDHTTHHLSYHGLSDRQVALVMGALSLTSFLIIWAFVHFNLDWNIWFTIGGFTYFVVHFFWLYRITLKHKYRDLHNIPVQNGAKQKEIEERVDY